MKTGVGNPVKNIFFSTNSEFNILLTAMTEKIKEVVQAFQKGSDQINSLLDVFPQMVWTASPDGEIDFFNNFSYEFTGWCPGTVPGHDWVNLIHPDDVAPSLEKWNKSLENGSPYEVEQRIFRKSDGAYIWHIVRASPLKNEKGKILKWLGTSVDIHAQKRVEENLSNFVYIASHDLRSPVNNIKSLISLFNTRPQEEWEKLLPMLNTSAERLSGTLQGMTEVIAIEKQEDPAKQVYFDSVLDHVIEDLGPELKEAEPVLYSDFSAAPGLKFPESHIRSIFYNLLGNAVKYSAPDRKNEIRIRSFRKDSFYVLSFSDKGTGVNLEYNREKLFRPFTRLTTAKEGKGMGLYLVRNMVEKNGGSIEVESEEGKGTTFTIYLREYQ